MAGCHRTTGHGAGFQLGFALVLEEFLALALALAFGICLHFHWHTQCGTILIGQQHAHSHSHLTWSDGLRSNHPRQNNHKQTNFNSTKKWHSKSHPFHFHFLQSLLLLFNQSINHAKISVAIHGNGHAIHHKWTGICHWNWNRRIPQFQHHVVRC